MTEAPAIPELGLSRSPGDPIRAEVDYQAQRSRLELRKEFLDRYDSDRAKLEKELATYRQWIILLGGGIGALIVAVGVAWASNVIRAEVAQSAQRIRAEVISEVMASLDAERSISTLLPLVVGEAIDINNYDDDSLSVEGRIYSESLVIEALGQIGPAVENLDGFAFDLAARRLERILDTFWTHGRYYEMHAAFSALSPQLQRRLLSHRGQGILYTITDGLASELLLDGALPIARNAVLQMVQEQTPQPETNAHLPLATLSLFQIARDTGWGSAQTVARLSIDSDRWPDLVNYLYENLVCFSYKSLPEDPTLFGPRNNDIASRLTVFSALMSDRPLSEICAAYND